RTNDLRFRKPLLYPAELRAQGTKHALLARPWRRPTPATTPGPGDDEDRHTQSVRFSRLERVQEVYSARPEQVENGAAPSMSRAPLEMASVPRMRGQGHQRSPETGTPGVESILPLRQNRR